MRINIEIGDIEAFIELSETNSFAKAANNLSLSQPALSRRIQKLEQELGTTLFDRTTRKVQLSYSGRNFYDRARGIIEAIKTATKTLNENVWVLFACSKACSCTCGLSHTSHSLCRKARKHCSWPDRVAPCLCTQCHIAHFVCA